MNKKEFIDELKKELNYPEEKCIIINDTLESNFFLDKKNKDKIIDELSNNLEVDNEEANKIYDVATHIIKEEVKYKLKHPFKTKIKIK